MSPRNSKRGIGGLCSSAPFKILHRLGLVSPRIKVVSSTLGRGFHPAHFRVQAPEGMIIDDVELADSDGKLITSGFDIQFHHARVSILDYGLPPGSYIIALKVNPKRSHFLYPALAAALIMMILSAIGLLEGPCRVFSHRELSAAMFIIPSVAAIFMVRDSEHEIVSYVLTFHRICLGVASLLMVVSGATIAAGENTPLHRWVLLPFLLSSLLLSLLETTLLSQQIFRIGSMRKVVQSGKGALDIEKRARSLLFWGVVAAIVIIIALTVGLVIWHIFSANAALRLWMAP